MQAEVSPPMQTKPLIVWDGAGKGRGMVHSPLPVPPSYGMNSNVHEFSIFELDFPGS